MRVEDVSRPNRSRADGYDGDLFVAALSRSRAFLNLLWGAIATFYSYRLYEAAQTVPRYGLPPDRLIDHVSLYLLVGSVAVCLLAIARAVNASSVAYGEKRGSTSLAWLEGVELLLCIGSGVGNSLILINLPLALGGLVYARTRLAGMGPHLY